MARGPIFETDYRPQFAGHETFPLRYGWLKKAFDAVLDGENSPDSKAVFSGEDAIARFGVGKNMVASMRHWATAAGVIADSGRSTVRTTELGRKIFGPDGLDPYMEHPATMWLVHWHLSAYPTKTTWFWAFNHFPAVSFVRDQVSSRLIRLATEQGWPRASANTITKDVSCFVRTYSATRPSAHAPLEDTLESPLTELGLIKAIGKRDGFRFVRGAKSTLGNGVFAYALADFWLRSSGATTMSFEVLAHEPGSPGRVLLLNEDDLLDHVVRLDEATDGLFQWSETAGLKQVVRTRELSKDRALALIDQDYAFDASIEGR